MKKLPLGIQNFREIIEENHVYVDKTMYVHKLITEGKSYFLSRPRRFGKSLLLDTIAEVFRGNKELFKGLWIYDSDYDFKSYPVLKLDLSNVDNSTPAVFKKSLINLLRRRARDEGVEIGDETPADSFTDLIEGMYGQYNQKVVVLIDEYDVPILDHITEIETAEANRDILRGIFKALKSLDSHIKFIFFTGVSKFTRTSIFSSLNNVADITMLKKYSDICGIPIGELDYYFGDHIKNLEAKKVFESHFDIRETILAWYDGYSWNSETKLLNPYALLSFFHSEEIKSFWYVSGSPKFLIDLIKKSPESVPKLQNPIISERDMDAVDLANLDITSLLFQTGYLTVSKVVYIRATPAYELEIPNLEVREAFFTSITAGLTENRHDVASGAFRQIDTALSSGDMQTILKVLRSLFSSIPYQLHINAEAYYHSIFYAVMNVLGFKIHAEMSVSMGRIDAVLELGDKVYVFEFKYKHCPPDADEDKKRKLSAKALEIGMKQLKEKGYADKFVGSGKTVYQAVFAFLGRSNVEMLIDSSML